MLPHAAHQVAANQPPIPCRHHQSLMPHPTGGGRPPCHPPIIESRIRVGEACGLQENNEVMVGMRETYIHTRPAAAHGHPPTATLAQPMHDHQRISHITHDPPRTIGTKPADGLRRGSNICSIPHALPSAHDAMVRGRKTGAGALTCAPPSMHARPAPRPDRLWCCGRTVNVPAPG
ncbi:hypothetical protein GCM10017771_94410 [Streptomyces capitiformicae]|uniref:Uncharacterized protein n=1 Tax=Streptomyces capitiformicae TaxID=2014920 RepID=A0A918ZVC9_9ACTN|nr:hypothetical protein GCM10017771_94410 [Streptomyces capitiformicae]